MNRVGLLLVISVGCAGPTPTPADPQAASQHELQSVFADARRLLRSGDSRSARAAFQRCVELSAQSRETFRTLALCKYELSMIPAERSRSQIPDDCVERAETAQAPTTGPLMLFLGEVSAPLSSDAAFEVLLAVRAEYERRGVPVATEAVHQTARRLAQERRIRVSGPICAQAASYQSIAQQMESLTLVSLELQCFQSGDCVLEVRGGGTGGSEARLPTHRAAIARGQAHRVHAWSRGARRLAPMALDDPAAAPPLLSFGPNTLERALSFGFDAPVSRILLAALLEEMSRCEFWQDWRRHLSLFVSLEIDGGGNASVLSVPAEAASCVAAALPARTQPNPGRHFASGRSPRFVVLELASLPEPLIRVCNHRSIDESLARFRPSYAQQMPALSACAAQSAVAEDGLVGLAVRTQVAASGGSSEVTASLVHLLGSDAREASWTDTEHCFAEALREVGWPCTLGPEGAEVAHELWFSPSAALD